MVGGLLLVAIMLISSVSVIGRGLSQVFGAKVSGIPGDVEVVQLGCAVAVFAFLPLCQLKRANVLVGAFTNNLPVRYRSMFDLAANLSSLTLRVLRDDGIVVYLNGTEILRDNLPAGAIG